MKKKNRKPIISIIAAVAENLGIGKNNKLLWNIPEDLQHFKKITTGHAVIMGQKTYESLGKPLTNRINIVLSRDESFKPVGCIVAQSIDAAIKQAKKKEEKEIFFIGGGQIYSQALPIADKLYITLVSGSYDADTFFPDYSKFKNLKTTGESRHGKLQYKFLELTR